MDIFYNTVKCQNINYKLNIISDRKFLYRLEAPGGPDSVFIVFFLIYIPSLCLSINNSFLSK